MSETGSSRRYLEDMAKFEKSMILLYDWAKIWHRQSGGYTASDTLLLLMRVEKYIALIQKVAASDRNIAETA